MKRKWLWMGLVSLLVAGLAALLYLVPPGTSGLYPRCLFHSLTGLDCPGCGGLRAMHQLLHGNISRAFNLNPLFVVLIPPLAWIGFCQIYQYITGRKLNHPFRHPAWLWVLLALLIVFSIVRNIPSAHAETKTPPSVTSP